jgi:hypothetical protein
MSVLTLAVRQVLQYGEVVGRSRLNGSLDDPVQLERRNIDDDNGVIRDVRRLLPILRGGSICGESEQDVCSNHTAGNENGRENVADSRERNGLSDRRL